MPLSKLAQGDFVSPEQIESVYLCSPLIEQIFISGLAIHSFLVGIAVTNVSVLRKAMSDRHDMKKYVELPDEQMLSQTEVRNFVLNEINVLARQKKLQTIELIKNIRLVSQASASFC
ncbi:hypothetical protein KIN20_007996 [Parelaphostrongylus tenuis]|uniref:Uncharacterized protein n=1 Tax=Parelaphostrongylus tenuis TaxID=148309 RepID=A0AAD5M444_PARTN|nr:hypothetical protein KIN20_007996 [Parelaphostrongylus tenuis]